MMGEKQRNDDVRVVARCLAIIAKYRGRAGVCSWGVGGIVEVFERTGPPGPYIGLMDPSRMTRNDKRYLKEHGWRYSHSHGSWRLESDGDI
jgi:hypothetical protein